MKVLKKKIKRPKIKQRVERGVLKAKAGGKDDNGLF